MHNMAHKSFQQQIQSVLWCEYFITKQLVCDEQMNLLLQRNFD